RRCGECCDDQFWLGPPAPVDGGPAHSGLGRHAVDRQTGVALVVQDLERGIEYGFVVAGVARPPRAPVRAGGAVLAPACITVVRCHRPLSVPARHSCELVYSTL